MNVLILGGGGRECAMAWKIAKSPSLSDLYIAPGNAGTSAYGQNIDLSVTDFEGIAQFCIDQSISMIIVGPELPLVDGIYDYFQREHLAHINVVGPSQEGAQLEGSKAYAKAFMARHDIPTADYIEVNTKNLEEGIAHLEANDGPYVLKADGLAAGKGVLIIDERAEAIASLRAMLDGQFGAASELVVIEQFLDGIEFSVFVLTDGSDYQILPIAKDYKRIGEGDTGLNTGGMGAVSPVPFVDEVLYQKVIERIVEPTVDGLIAEDIDYKGFIFIGLINVGGEPYVIEYNCRMGDPETEVVLPRLESDLLTLLASLADQSLDEQEVVFDERAAATVMLVSGGYPGSYEKGKEMTGLEEMGESIAFHAGTKLENSLIKTNGGRVLAITSYGENHTEAVQKSLTKAEQVQFEGKYYRKDIGADLA